MSEDRSFQLPVTVGLSAFGLLTLVLFLLCLTPPVSRDALIHHLTVPKLYLKHGGMVELPYMRFSYYPGNLHLLYLLPLAAGNDILPKVIHWTFGLGTALLVFFYLRPRAGKPLGLLGAVFFLSVPAIVRLAISAYVDLGVVFFSTAALLCFLRWRDTGVLDRWFWGGAALTGLALGTKYNGLIVLFLLSSFVILVSVRTHRKGPFSSVGRGMLYAAAALVVFSPWMLRNGVWTGNPIYPLFPGLFSSDEGPAAGGARMLGLLTYRRDLFEESWLEVFLLPFRLFFQGEDDNLRLFDGRLNPGLLMLPVFAFRSSARGADHAERRWLALFCLLYFAFTFFGRELRARYFVPMVPALVILSVLGVRELFHRFSGMAAPGRRPVAQGFLIAGIGGVLFWNAVYLGKQIDAVRPWTYWSGAVSRGEYIALRRPEYPAMEFINQHLPRDARILFFFVGNRGYYCDRDYRFDIPSRTSFLREAANSGESIAERLRAAGITHFLVRLPVFQEWILEDLTATERQRMKTFFDKRTSRLFLRNGYGVFELNLE